MTLQPLFRKFTVHFFGIILSDYLFAFVISYLIGSIPTAYLVVQQTSHIDIRNAGSGNVGGRNALEVTGKKRVGVIVVGIDVLKGFVAVLIAKTFFGDQALAVSGAMGGAVLGHCYPVWLKFKGGRGLATAAGVFFAVNWIWPIWWLVIYFLSSATTRNVHQSSVISLVATPVMAWILPDVYTSKLLPDFFSPDSFIAAGILPIAIALSRHIQPLKEAYEQQV